MEWLLQTPSRLRHSITQLLGVQGASNPQLSPFLVQLESTSRKVVTRGWGWGNIKRLVQQYELSVIR